MSVDLCVINFNTERKLYHLFHYLNSDYVSDSWNLYVADNGSTDGTVEALKQTQQANFQHHIDKIFFNENIGYAAAANQLAAQGTGEIIGIINADVWMSTADVKSIEKAFDQNPDIAILGPKQRNEKGKIVHAGIFGDNTAPKHRGWMQDDPKDLYYRDVDEAVTVSGSAYFIRRIVWDEITNHPKYQQMIDEFKESGLINDFRCGTPGAFLPTPHYFEETWCSYFARFLGYRTFYDGRISIGHSWNTALPETPDKTKKLKELFRISRGIFVEACDYFGIRHDWENLSVNSNR